MNNSLITIKKTILNRLESLKNLNVDKYQLISKEILEEICDITEETGREIVVYIDRRGTVLDVCVGDKDTASLKALSNRRSMEGLSGVRCIHTHPKGNGMLSEVDLSALEKTKFDIMAAIGVSDGLMTNGSLAFLGLDDEGKARTIIVGPYSEERLLKINILELINNAEAYIKKVRKTSNLVENDIERAILASSGGGADFEELRELLKTAGGFEAGRIVLTKGKNDTAYFIGKGKLKELSLLSQTANVNLVVFDEELSGAQIRNLEEALGVKVIDRTQLILDIFAQRARSKEGKLQVELAQFRYMLPRLTGMGVQMSRTGGGIGTRGPGEKKLETDRRRIRDRINDLENEIKMIERHREIQREGRSPEKTFQICLVGYTNSGKSTLLNSLSNSEVYSGDQLFATLDPTVRKAALHNGREVLVTDTVGFIKKLPHDLIKAFRSTLEEVLYADLLIHVVDGSNPDHDIQMKAVMDVLTGLGAEGKAMITAINKIDRCPGEFPEPECNSADNIVYISALNGTGLPKLLTLIEKHADLKLRTVELLIPYSEGNAVSEIFDSANEVISEEYREKGVYVKAGINEISYGRLKKYLIN